jgi:hypothetical protein
MAINVSAVDRLAILLPWLNREPLSRAQIIADLKRFLSLSAAGDLLGLIGEPHGATTQRQLARLRQGLVTLLASVQPDPDRPRPWSAADRALPSLRFRLSRGQPLPGKRPRGGWDDGGTYVLCVDGRLRDILIYGVLRALTERGMVTLRRCPAPAVGGGVCGKWLVGGPRRGRPSVFCNVNCRVRAHAHQRKER